MDFSKQDYNQNGGDASKETPTTALSARDRRSQSRSGESSSGWWL